jgi:Cof subfamily protein (haloacid dehalogenase superfamily)
MSKIYVSDLDGTLLRNDGTISDFSKENLTRLLNDGMYFTAASARSVVAMQKILKGIPFQLPIIEFNGAFISDLETGRHEIINEMDHHLVPEIHFLIKQYNCLPFISTFNGQDDCLYYESLINEGMSWYRNDRTRAGDKRLRQTSKLSDSFLDHIICFTIINRKNALSELAAKINTIFSEKVEVHLFENQYSPGWYWLTIHDRRATKDQAIRILLDKMGLHPSELTVFGDNSNDIKMFKIAGTGVSVANATEELKQYASLVIGTNEEDSVVRYLMREDN